MRKKFTVQATNDKNKFVQLENNKLWYKTQARVLYADTDAAQVVYHANYLKYFEIGRAELIRDFGSSYKYIEEKNIYHPIVKIDVDYHYPARYDDLLDIYVRPDVAEVVKFEIQYKVINNETGKLLVEGGTIHCCTIEGLKPCLIDDITQGLFDAYK